MKVKILSRFDSEDLEKDINNFMLDIGAQGQDFESIMEMQFSTVVISSEHERMVYSVLIRYS